MDASDIAWLRSAAGERALAQAAAWLADGASELAILERLRRDLAPDEARAVLALLEGRRSAAGKFADAAALFLDREAAEQATSEAVARHTARRFEGARLIADLGAGAGGDALALAERARVLAIDRDPARLAMLEANADVRGFGQRIETSEGDAGAFALPPDVDAVWLDPSRRDASGRVRDPERWSPPLSVALAIASSVARAGIKVAPGIDLDAVRPERGALARAIPPPQPSPARGEGEILEVEFISHAGTLVEAVIWLGAAVTAPRRATVLRSDAGDEGTSIAGEPDAGATPLRDPGRYLYDLDPSVGRASLVDVAAPLLRAWRLDERTAYLSGDEASDSPFARRFRIDAWLAFSERRLREALAGLGVARVEVMRRASPVDTNALEARLNASLGGSAGRLVRTVALTRVRGTHVAVIGERER